MTLAKGRETRESPSRMDINLFLARTGYRKASWQHPVTDPSLAATFEHYIALAAAAEAACLDSVFVSDDFSCAVDLHNLYLTLQPRPAVRVAGSYQRWQSRVKHCNDRRRTIGA